MKWLKNDKGFTFLELTIVVAIIGFLMMIGLPNYKSAADKAQKKSCEANRKLIESQVESYYIDEHVYPPADVSTTDENDTIKELIEKEYLKSEPKCPSKGNYTIILPTASTSLTITCNVHTDPEE